MRAAVRVVAGDACQVLVGALQHLLVLLPHSGGLRSILMLALLGDIAWSAPRPWHASHCMPLSAHVPIRPGLRNWLPIGA